MDALVNVLAKLGDGGLGDAGHAHGLDEFIDPPGADPADPRFLDHRNQRFLDHLAGLKEARKIGPSTQLGDFQVQRAYPGIQRTVAIAVAPGRALAAARSEEHTSELQSLMRISYAVFCLKKKKK